MKFTPGGWPALARSWTRGKPTEECGVWGCHPWSTRPPLDGDERGRRLLCAPSSTFFDALFWFFTGQPDEMQRGREGEEPDPPEAVPTSTGDCCAAAADGGSATRAPPCFVGRSASSVNGVRSAEFGGGGGGGGRLTDTRPCADPSLAARGSALAGRGTVTTDCGSDCRTW